MFFSAGLSKQVEAMMTDEKLDDLGRHTDLLLLVRKAINEESRDFVDTDIVLDIEMADAVKAVLAAGWLSKGRRLGGLGLGLHIAELLGL